MPSDRTAGQNIYQLFGVDKLAGRLKAKNDKQKLEQLDKILTKYILSKAVDDLPEKSFKKLTESKIKNGQELHHFFDQYISNFPTKLNQYGRDFKQEFAQQGITS